MKIHIVQKGDTLWEIAKKYGVDFEEIKQLNSQLSSPDMIMPGMKIKIPSSTKPVKKESMIKETGKPKVEQPLKGIPPKPLSTIMEDDMKKPKEFKVEMPLPQMPQAAPMQPMMQMPVMEQEMQNYTTINFPEFPHYEKKEEKLPKKESKQEYIQQMPLMQTMPQMPQQQMPIVPMCCHFIHPCCHQMHHHHFAKGFMPPEAHSKPQQMMHHPGLGKMEIPENPMHLGEMNDCGCQSKSPFPYHHMRQPIPMDPPIATGGGFDPLEFKQYQAQSAHALESNKYPPQFSHEPVGRLYPTPPEYPLFSGSTDPDDDNSTSE